MTTTRFVGLIVVMTLIGIAAVLAVYGLVGYVVVHLVLKFW